MTAFLVAAFLVRECKSDPYVYLRPFKPKEEARELVQNPRVSWDLPPRFWVRVFSFPKNFRKGADAFLMQYWIHFTFNGWKQMDLPGDVLGVYDPRTGELQIRTSGPNGRPLKWSDASHQR